VKKRRQKPPRLSFSLSNSQTTNSESHTQKIQARKTVVSHLVISLRDVNQDNGLSAGESTGRQIAGMASMLGNFIPR